MEEAPLEMLLAALRDGKLDIVVSRIRASELSDSFRHEILYNERFVVVQSAISGMEQHLSLQPADLFQMAWILPPPDTLVRQHVDNFFAVQYGRVPPITIESASPIANLALLNSSNSIAVMAKQLADFFVNQGVIRTIPIDLGTFTRPVALITLRGQTRAPHIDHMIELLRSGAETIESGAMQGANADT